MILHNAKYDNIPRQKRVAAIHDLSGFGKCSLTVILPTLSAMGIQVCPVPTAVLSTHTGGFDNMVFKDLTDYISPAYEHYKQLGIEFDAIYSGFLASEAQIDCCLEFFTGNGNALKIADPVMGDFGKPYKTYTKQMCMRMSELAAVADIITPNLTEAAILLNEDYKTQLTLSQTQDWLKRLCEFAPMAVITGVNTGDEICNVSYERESGSFNKIIYEYVPEHYPGTGDIFTSVLTGALLQGDELSVAVSRATDFAQATVELTFAMGSPPREGVLFEGMLGDIMKW